MAWKLVEISDAQFNSKWDVFQINWMEDNPDLSEHHFEVYKNWKPLIDDKTRIDKKLNFNFYPSPKFLNEYQDEEDYYDSFLSRTFYYSIEENFNESNRRKKGSKLHIFNFNKKITTIDMDDVLQVYYQKVEDWNINFLYRNKNHNQFVFRHNKIESKIDSDLLPRIYPDSKININFNSKDEIFEVNVSNSDRSNYLNYFYKINTKWELLNWLAKNNLSNSYDDSLQHLFDKNFTLSDDKSNNYSLNQNRTKVLKICYDKLWNEFKELDIYIKDYNYQDDIINFKALFKNWECISIPFEKWSDWKYIIMKDKDEARDDIEFSKVSWKDIDTISSIRWINKISYDKFFINEENWDIVYYMFDNNKRDNKIKNNKITENLYLNNKPIFRSKDLENWMVDNIQISNNNILFNDEDNIFKYNIKSDKLSKIKIPSVIWNSPFKLIENPLTWNQFLNTKSNKLINVKKQNRLNSF